MAVDKSIAALRHRVVIETPTESSDGQGGQTVSWATHATVWASFQPWKGFEVNFAERIEDRTLIQMVIRDLPTLNSKMRISFRNEIWQIKSFDRFENGKTFFMKLLLHNKVGS